MSLRPLASLTVKMLGLYAVINALPTISLVIYPFLASHFSSSSSPLFSPLTMALLNASGGTLQMLVGIGLWWFSEGIARSAVPEDGDIPVQANAPLTSVAFSLVGAYLLCDSVAHLAAYATNVYVVSQTGTLLRPENARIGVGDLVPILVRGALALTLLFGSRGLVRGLAKLKNAGRDAEETT